MFLLSLLLICTLYFGIALGIIFEHVDAIQYLVFFMLVIIPIVNVIYGLVGWSKSRNKLDMADKWKQILLRTKIILIPFYTINFIIWSLATLVGIVPVFMFLLVLTPIMGFIFTYWIFLSTITYSIAIIREYYNAGYYHKFLFIVLIISQFIFVADVVGIIVLDILVKANKGKANKGKARRMSESQEMPIS